MIDLNSNKIIRRHRFKDTDLRPSSTLASVTVDISGFACNTPFAYIPDLGSYGLLVYDFFRNSSWRVSHNYFYLEPLAGDFLINGLQFQWNDGIFSIALSGAKTSNGEKDAYFHSMAGTHLYKVSTRILRNETLATRSFHGGDFQVSD